MIDVTIHCRGVGSERRTLAALPPIGAYLYSPVAERRLWLIEDVIFDNGMVNLYVIEVSVGLAAEMTAEWAAWCNTTAPTADATKESQTGS